MNLMWHGRRFWMVGTLSALASCGPASGPADSSTVEQRGRLPTAVAPRESEVRPEPAGLTDTLATTVPSGIRSCSAELGEAPASRKVAVCRNVSPATHPPCNAANSCAMIDSEIARSCALFDDKAAPMADCGPSPKSTQAAVAVIRRYYSAINARDYDTAWSQWGDNGQQGQTRARFEKGFLHTRQARVTIGQVEPGDAGAGSIYQPVPVTVDTTLADGTRQRFRGVYVVRRVNDVDGASAAQLRWHIGSGKLKRIPVE